MFHSKIDAWLIVVLLMATAVPAIGVVSSAREGLNWWPSAAATLFVVVGFAWLLLPTKYTVENAKILVQCGPFRWVIPGNSINGITPSRSLVSGPALSLDRLRIDFESRRKSILVSPKDKDAFIQAVRALMHTGPA